MKQKNGIRPGANGKGQGRTVLLVGAAALLLLLISGCALPAEYAGVSDHDEAPAAEPVPERERRAAEDAAAEGVDEVAAAEEQRYVIRNARLSLEIENMDEAVKQLQIEAERMNGYVSSLDIYNLSEERRAGTVTLRIPEDRFDEALEMVKGLGKIRNEQFDTDDVTRRYIDMEARIANLEAQEQRLRALLEKADTVEDVIKVEHELGRVRGDLEAMKGEFQYLRERVRYSSFQLRLEERDPRTMALSDSGVSWEQAGELMILNPNRLFRGVAGLTIWFVGSLPLIIPLAGVGFLGWKAVSSGKKRKMKKKEQQEG